MTISLTYFGPAREAVGLDREELEIAGRLTVAELLEWLRSERPLLRPIIDSCRVAVGTRYATPEEGIEPDADVALIPPVAGG